MTGIRLPGVSINGIDTVDSSIAKQSTSCKKAYKSAETGVCDEKTKVEQEIEVGHRLISAGISETAPSGLESGALALAVNSAEEI